MVSCVGRNWDEEAYIEDSKTREMKYSKTRDIMLGTPSLKRQTRSNPGLPSFSDVHV